MHKTTYGPLFWMLACTNKNYPGNSLCLVFSTFFCIFDTRWTSPRHFRRKQCTCLGCLSWISMLEDFSSLFFIFNTFLRTIRTICVAIVLLAFNKEQAPTDFLCSLSLWFERKKCRNNPITCNTRENVQTWLQLSVSIKKVWVVLWWWNLSLYKLILGLE